MKADPILEELWKAKKQIAAEHDFDVYKLGASLRKFEKEYLADRQKKAAGKTKAACKKCVK